MWNACSYYFHAASHWQITFVGLKQESENRLSNAPCVSTCLKRCITLSHLSLVPSQKEDWIAHLDRVLSSLPSSLQWHQLTNKAKAHPTGHKTLYAHQTTWILIWRSYISSSECEMCCDPVAVSLSFTSWYNQMHSLHSIIKSFINYSQRCRCVWPLWWLMELFWITLA